MDLRSCGTNSLCFMLGAESRWHDEYGANIDVMKSCMV